MDPSDKIPAPIASRFGRDARPPILLFLAITVIFPGMFLSVGMLLLLAHFNIIHMVGKSGPPKVPLAVGLLFFTVAVMLGMVFGRVIADVQGVAKGQRNHPDKPWLWKGPWRRGRGKRDGRSAPAPLMAVCFGMVFLLFGISLASSHSRSRVSPEVVLLISCVLYAVAIFSFAWALRDYLMLRRLPRSACELLTLPAVLGESLVCRIHFNGGAPVLETISGEVRCDRRETGRAAKSKLMDIPVWNGAASVSQASLSTCSDSAIDFTCALPTDLPESSEFYAYGIRWSLVVRSRGNLIERFVAQYVVPVFSKATIAGRP